MMHRFLLSTVLVSVIFISGCCSHPTAVKSLKDAIAINQGHMGDKALPQEARLIAQDNYDLDNQVLYSLTGDPLPSDTAQRMKDRQTGGDK